MRAAHVCAALLALAAGAADAVSVMRGFSTLASWWSAAGRAPPSFPAAFEAEYTFTLPYVQVVQTKGLSFPVHVWFDKEAGRLRLDVYGGLDKVIQTDEETVYTMYPRLNVTACDVSHGSAGPTAAALAARLLRDAPLPPLDGWRFAGTTELRGHQVEIWTLRERLSSAKTAVYTFYIRLDGAPARLYMMGSNIVQYSHYDEYLIDFDSWKPGKPASSVFAVPNSCPDAARRSARGGGAPGGAAEARVAAAAALMPWTRVPHGGGGGGGGSAGLGAGADVGQRPLLARAAARAAAARFVAAHDASAAGYEVALNRFADWAHEEYAALATSRRAPAPGPAAAAGRRPLGVLTSVGVSRGALPRHVDWRGSGADNVVKDQATCGSCWAFAATGTMEGAWNVATGDTLSLSEQQLVDCSWEHGSNGCGGGYMESAIQYAAEAGGAMSEEAYQYLGQNAFCGVNATRPLASPVARFLGYAQVASRDEAALMAAVATLGPVAVSIDASDMGFKYFAGGVYSNPRCSNRDLDHAVLVVGYGTTKRGVPYWLIKNSWSTYWGDNGYVKMLRTSGDGVDCGVTTDPVVAIPLPAAAAAAAARNGRPAWRMPRLARPGGRSPGAAAAA